LKAILPTSAISPGKSNFFIKLFIFYIEKIKFKRDEIFSQNMTDELKKVTAAVIIQDGKVLIAQRMPGDSLEYRWEFPGGKLDPGETVEECIVREIKEELGVDIEIIKRLTTARNKKIELIFFQCKIISGELQKIEVNDFAWIDDMEGYDLLEMDRPVLNEILIQMNNR
jgi:8-oxo-dGTP diphosphatase